MRDECKCCCSWVGQGGSRPARPPSPADCSSRATPPASWVRGAWRRVSVGFSTHGRGKCLPFLFSFFPCVPRRNLRREVAPGGELRAQGGPLSPSQPARLQLLLRPAVHALQRVRGGRGDRHPTRPAAHPPESNARSRRGILHPGAAVCMAGIVVCFYSIF